MSNNIEYIYKNTENIRQLKNIKNIEQFTHYVLFNDELKKYNINNLIDIINNLKFINVHFIISKKIYEKIKSYRLKDNNSYVICNCISCCNCIENNYVEVFEDILKYEYDVIKITEISIMNKEYEISGLIFNL